ncbi:hypothetical protein GCM10023339_40240 [Alloalcanivorax gelatiniphagus]
MCSMARRRAPNGYRDARACLPCPPARWPNAPDGSDVEARRDVTSLTILSPPPASRYRTTARLNGRNKASGALLMQWLNPTEPVLLVSGP